MSHNDITDDRLTSKIGDQKADAENFEKIFDKPLDKSMGITNTEYCSAGSHYVKSDNMRWLEVGKNGKRKLCVDCKEKAENAKQSAKKMV